MERDSCSLLYNGMDSIYIKARWAWVAGRAGKPEASKLTVPFQVALAPALELTEFPWLLVAVAPLSERFIHRKLYGSSGNVRLWSERHYGASKGGQTMRK